MNLLEKLSSFFKQSDKTTAFEALKTFVTPLADIDADYPDRVLAYIFSGEGADILLELHQRNDDLAGALLDFPGTYERYYYAPTRTTLSKAQQKRHNSLVDVRKNKIYPNLFNWFSHEQIIRYGKFLQAVCQEHNFIAFAPNAPTWFLYIVVDALNTVVRHYQFKLNVQQTWTQAQLLSLLQADGIDQPEAVLIETLFERKGIKEYYHDDLSLIYKLSDTLDFLNQHTELLYHSLTQLSISAQKLFLNDFKAAKNTDFLNQHAKLLVALSLSPSKAVRDIAASRLSLIDSEKIRQHLPALLTQGDSKQRAAAADLLARGGEANRTLLENALANEKQKSVQASIQSALQRLDSLAEIIEEDNVLPPFEPIISQDIPDSFLPIMEANYQELLEKKRQAAEREIEANKSISNNGWKSDWAQKEYKQWQKYSEAARTTLLLAQLNGKSKFKNYHLIPILTHKKAIFQCPEYGMHHALRLLSTRYISWDDLFDNYLEPKHFEHLELRQLAQVMQDVGISNPARHIASGYLQNSYYDTLSQYISRPEQVVPFFTEHSEFITEALGLAPNQSDSRWVYFQPSYAIELLAKFPSVPKQYVAKLLELALGQNKKLRFEAQELLQTLPHIHQRAIEALGNSKQEIRISAIDWLARLGNPEAIQPLYALLKKEKKEIVIAALLTALETLGEDISSYLTPKALLADAEKGLQGKISASFTWFNLNSLPAMKWQNSKPVAPQIIQWWVVLAEKLKDPQPNALFQRYLNLLDDKSRQTLSLFILQTFIERDTQNCSIAEATEYAVARAPATLQDYHRWAKNYPDYYAEYAHYTLEQVIEELKRQKLGEYLGSAIKSKGMLALIGHAQGSLTIKILQDFMKNHFLRRAQIEAMLHAISNSNDPLIIQFLLGISRRYRTASIQELAKQLVSQIAERNHWTADELADRTIPSAGLDEQGELILEYGSRTLTAYVDNKDKFVLKNEEGKIIKSLPAARHNDDASLIKEAKTQFSNAKKEYKQVLELQTTRLYEAMCAERAWTSSDWQEYLLAHPIMKRLIARVVWLETDADGNILQQFRPSSEDGCLLNLEDDEIELQAHSHIRLAHRVLISADDAQAWLAHFKDYKVKPLFEQMTHDLPEFKPNDNSINTRKGWLTDTYTLRGVLNKLGYQRASIEDAGSFDRYFKPFDALNLSAVISFSGSYVPEENIPAVLYNLSFDKQQAYSWNDRTHLLGTIPRVLLAESYADYLKVAEACTGFDPEWEKKTPW